MNGVSLDPRTKLILSLAYTFVIAMSKDMPWLLLEFGLLSVCILWLRLGRAWLNSFKLILSMVVIVFAISIISFDLLTALRASLRLLTIVSIFFVFFQTTLPEDLGNALIKVGLPYEFAFILSASLRFVPVISRKIKDIMDAQRARGLSFHGLKNYSALLAPLLIQSFKISDDLAEAMESRGFGCKGRTFLKEYRLRGLDYLLIFIALLALIAFWRGFGNF